VSRTARAEEEMVFQSVSKDRLMNDTTEANAADDAAPKPPLPDRLSVNPKSDHFSEAVLAHSVGVRFNGAEKNNVEEYCVSEGWIRVAAGKALDRKGNPLTLKLNGVVEPYYRD
jgi:hypothetical protein